jgi:RNA polymerase sigma-70 factor (ECF subfamily)
VLIKTENLKLAQVFSTPARQERDDTALLIKRIAHKDRAALAEFYARFQRPLFNYVLRLLGHEALAEDLLQEVMLIVWQQAQSYRGKATVKSWLFSIAHHQAYKVLRQRAREVSLDSALDNQPALQDLPDDTITPEDSALRRATGEEVNKALSYLSAEHREVLELAFYQEFSTREIATIVGIPEGTVKSRLSYARRALKAALLSNGWED